MRIRVTLAMLLLGVLLPSCGGGGGDTVTQTVVSSDGVLTVTVPANALAHDTTVSVTAAADAKLPDQVSALDHVGVIYSLEPEGQRFDHPVELRVRVAMADIAAGGSVGPVVLVGADGGVSLLDDEHVAFDASGATITGTTTHFSKAVVGRSLFDLLLSPDTIEAEVGASWKPVVKLRNPYQVARCCVKSAKVTATGAVGVKDDDNAGLYSSGTAAVPGAGVEGLTTFGAQIGRTLGQAPTVFGDLALHPTYECTRSGPGRFGVSFTITESVEDYTTYADLDLGRLLAASGITEVSSAVSIAGDAVCKASSTTTSTSSTTTSTTSITAPQPAYPSQIHATFDEAAFTTTYSVDVASTVGLTFAWTVSIPTDPGCAAGFTTDTPATKVARWFHENVSEGGPCNHAGTDGPAGHPGDVTVVVTSAAWRCEAHYAGTITGEGNPPICVRS